VSRSKASECSYPGQRSHHRRTSTPGSSASNRPASIERRWSLDGSRVLVTPPPYASSCSLASCIRSIDPAGAGPPVLVVAPVRAALLVDSTQRVVLAEFVCAGRQASAGVVDDEAVDVSLPVEGRSPASHCFSAGMAMEERPVPAGGRSWLILRSRAVTLEGGTRSLSHRDTADSPRGSAGVTQRRFRTVQRIGRSGSQVAAYVAGPDPGFECPTDHGVGLAQLS